MQLVSRQSAAAGKSSGSAAGLVCIPGYRVEMADNDVIEFQGGPRAPRIPHAVFDTGTEPDPLYTLANERTYLAWLRLALTLLAAAVAVDRLFQDHPWFASEGLALGLIGLAVVTCALGVRRWWSTERALRLRQPLPGFGAPLLGFVAVLLIGAGVWVLVAVPAG
jgi:putative membrane protein